MRPTVSALYLGGLIKHVAATEASWVRFAEGGAEAMNRNWGPDIYARHRHLLQGETLDGVLADYEAVAAHTDEVVATIPDLDADHALPEAPWFEPNARWSARRVFLHIIAETAQHAGHADILRESIDGQEDDGLSPTEKSTGRRCPAFRAGMRRRAQCSRRRPFSRGPARPRPPPPAPPGCGR